MTISPITIYPFSEDGKNISSIQPNTNNESSYQIGSAAASAFSTGIHLTGRNNKAPLIDPPYDIDKEVNDIHMQETALKNNRATYTRETLNASLKEKKSLADQRQKRLQKLIDKNKKSASWGTFQKVLTAAGFIISAGSVISTGGISTPLAIALIVGGGLVLDNCTGDHLKEGIATLAVKALDGDESAEQIINNTLNIGSGLGVTAISILMGNIGGAAGMVKVVTNGISGSGTIVQGALSYQKGSLDAQGMKEGIIGETLKARMHEQISDSNEILNSVHDLITNLTDINKRRQEACSQALAMA